MSGDERADEQAETSRRTSEEHETIHHALHLLERAMTSPARRRERAWRRRCERDLRAVVSAIDAHGASAEGPDGLLPQLEQVLGRPQELTRARREHGELRERAAALVATLAQEGESAAVREQAEGLAQALRRHLALEADLVFETFERDIGVGD